MCTSVISDLFPETPPAEGEIEEKPRENDYEYATLTEDDKESMFLWLRTLCDAFPFMEMYDTRYQFLCYMYAEGYGCEPDVEKARQVIKNIPMADGSTRDALVKYAYAPKYEMGWLDPVAAYYLAEEWVEMGENLEQAKDWLTRVTTDSKCEKYRIAAQELLNKLG